MELPKKLLENLKIRLEEHSNNQFSKYNDKKGSMHLAKDIGEALELLEEDESRYIIEHSYDIVCSDKSISEKEWKKWIIKGMGEHHKSLQQEIIKELNTNKKRIEVER